MQRAVSADALPHGSGSNGPAPAAAAPPPSSSSSNANVAWGDSGDTAAAYDGIHRNPDFRVEQPAGLGRRVALSSTTPAPHMDRSQSSRRVGDRGDNMTRHSSSAGSEARRAARRQLESGGGGGGSEAPPLARDASWLVLHTPTAGSDNHAAPVPSRQLAASQATLRRLQQMKATHSYIRTPNGKQGLFRSPAPSLGGGGGGGASQKERQLKDMNKAMSGRAKTLNKRINVLSASLETSQRQVVEAHNAIKARDAEIRALQAQLEQLRARSRTATPPHHAGIPMLGAATSSSAAHTRVPPASPLHGATPAVTPAAAGAASANTSPSQSLSQSQSPSQSQSQSQLQTPAHAHTGKAGGVELTPLDVSRSYATSPALSRRSGSVTPGSRWPVPSARVTSAGSRPHQAGQQAQTAGSRKGGKSKGKGKGRGRGTKGKHGASMGRPTMTAAQTHGLSLAFRRLEDVEHRNAQLRRDLARQQQDTRRAKEAQARAEKALRSAVEDNGHLRKHIREVKMRNVELEQSWTIQSRQLTQQSKRHGKIAKALRMLDRNYGAGVRVNLDVAEGGGSARRKESGAGVKDPSQHGRVAGLEDELDEEGLPVTTTNYGRDSAGNIVRGPRRKATEEEREVRGWWDGMRCAAVLLRVVLVLALVCAPPVCVA